MYSTKLYLSILFLTFPLLSQFPTIKLQTQDTFSNIVKISTIALCAYGVYEAKNLFSRTTRIEENTEKIRDVAAETLKNSDMGLKLMGQLQKHIDDLDAQVTQNGKTLLTQIGKLIWQLQGMFFELKDQLNRIEYNTLNINGTAPKMANPEIINNLARSTCYKYYGEQLSASDVDKIRKNKLKQRMYLRLHIEEMLREKAKLEQEIENLRTCKSVSRELEIDLSVLPSIQTDTTNQQLALPQNPILLQLQQKVRWLGEYWTQGFVGYNTHI